MKSQAETAGHLTYSSGNHPQRGTVLRDLEITLANGTHSLLSSLRGSTSLVMVFTAGRDVQALLGDLAGRQSALKEHNARVLFISTSHEQPAAHFESSGEMFLFAFDEGAQLHKALGATDAAQRAIPTIYVTDRFGEVFAVFQTTDLASLPNAKEIIRWLEFIEQQCEECSPPEWQE